MRAVLAESQGDLTAAEASYRELVKLEPDDPWALAELADFMKRRQDQNPAAVEMYHKVLDADPSYIRPHVDLCQVYTRVDDHPLAEKEAQLAIERYRVLGMKSGEAQALQCLGEAEREQGGEHLADARRNIDAARGFIDVLNQPYNLSRVVFYQALVAYSSDRIARRGGSVRNGRDRGRRGRQPADRRHGADESWRDELTARPSDARHGVLPPQPRRFVQLKDERRVAEADVNEAGLQMITAIDPDAARRTLANARVNLERLGHVDFQLIAMQSEADNYRYAGRVAEARRLLQVGFGDCDEEADLRDKTRQPQRHAGAGGFPGERIRARPARRSSGCSKAAPMERGRRPLRYGRVLTALADFDGAQQALARRCRADQRRAARWLAAPVHAGAGRARATR